MRTCLRLAPRVALVSALWMRAVGLLQLASGCAGCSMLPHSSSCSW